MEDSNSSWLAASAGVFFSLRSASNNPAALPDQDRAKGFHISAPAKAKPRETGRDVA
jgi:hypothetical protein